MGKQKTLSRSVIVPDILITELRDRGYAESLFYRDGVMIHFGIKYSEMPYSRHYKNSRFGGEMWEFRSQPFELVSIKTKEANYD